MWDKLQIKNERNNNPNLLFPNKKLKKRTWEQITEKLKELLSLKSMFI